MAVKIQADLMLVNND